MNCLRHAQTRAQFVAVVLKAAAEAAIHIPFPRRDRTLAARPLGEASQDQRQEQQSPAVLSAWPKNEKKPPCTLRVGIRESQHSPLR
eukprot:15445356-Alexandrium_andersonii.AAC.1